MLKTENIAFTNLVLLLDLVLALLGINVSVEEVFSFVNSLKTTDKTNSK
jgi:hypothetical protein